MNERERFEAEAKEIAEAFASDFDAAHGVLDFSKDSLATLDAYLLGPAKALAAEDQRALALGAGAYLAEVIRRRAPVTLRWVSASVLPGTPDPANPFLLATPKNLVFAVLGKPQKLLDQGEQDSLVRFTGAVQDLCSREATSGG